MNQQWNRTQFEHAYREYRPRAVAVARSVLGDPTEAEDVVQDVFAELWRRPASFDPTRGPLRAYVTMLARSRAIDRRRTRVARDASVDRLVRQVEGEPARHAESAAERVVNREQKADVVSLVDELPPPQREAVLLAFGRGLTAREIALAVDIPVGTAKSRLRLGLERARTTLATAA